MCSLPVFAMGGAEDTSSGIYNLSTQSDTAINTKEKSISVTIGAIFVSCLVAEILYIAIFKCFLLGDLAIAKQVASVFLRGMVLFFVVINLPMIVELVRTGFQELAYTIAGARLDRDSSLLVMRDNVFNMPGTVIRSSVDIIEMINPANAGGMGISVIDAAEVGANTGFKTLTGIMVQVLYWVVQIICVIFLCVCAFHVMFNVIEVYLLIGIVSVLAPFQIFEVTRFMGERAIYSLFVNLVELFVIMVILYSCQGVLIYFQEWVSQTYMSQARTSISTEYSLPVTSSMPEADFNAIVSLATQYSIPWEQMTYDNYRYTVNNARDVSTRESINEKFIDIMEQAEIRITEEAILNKIIPLTSADRALLADGYSNTGDILYDRTKIENEADDGTLLQNMSMATRQKAINHVFRISSVLKKYGQAQSTYEINTDIVPVHLSSGLICVFMMFYFLGQSTQITNALMNGTAATDGFTGATMKFAAGKSLGLLVTAGGAGVKATGSAKRAGVDAFRNTKTASQHVTDNIK